MVAFVLSGGASLGAIQVGMLRALYERRITPDLIVGASAGAINGAYIASRPANAETVSSLADIWRSLRAASVFPPNPVTAVLALSGRRGNLVSNAGLQALVAAHLEFELLEDAPIPFHVIATDVSNGAERRLSKGDAAAAILASAAIPGLYPSITFGEIDLIDGGISNNTPISHAAELGASRIYVLPTGSPCEVSSPPRAAIPILVHALTLLTNQRLVSDIERFAHDAELVVLPPPCPLDVLASDFGHAQALMDAGYQLAATALDHPEPAQRWTQRALERLKLHSH